MKKNIAVIFGGQSSEHDVSCISATNVIEGLDRNKYDVHRIGITKEGNWLYVKDTESMKDGSWVNGSVTAILAPDHQFQGIWKKEGDKIEVLPIDVIFPVLHGLYGEDGTIQGLFEMSGIPYVGCGVLASAASMDKISTKVFAARIGVHQADYVVDIAKDCSEIENTMNVAEAKLGYPMFVKPSNAGSSQGVSKVYNREQLKAAIESAKEHDYRVLIEENIKGREIECAVLGGRKAQPSKVGEIISAAEFYDFDAKYNSAESKTVVDPEDIPEDVKEKVRVNALAIFKAVGGFGLSRVDFFVEENTNEVIFNEMNTLPGFTDISMYPMLWEAMGIGKTELLDRLIELAYER
jgi:D-alanine-D-alanine ligase